MSKLSETISPFLSYFGRRQSRGHNGFTKADDRGEGLHRKMHAFQEEDLEGGVATDTGKGGRSL